MNRFGGAPFGGTAAYYGRDDRMPPGLLLKPARISLASATGMRMPQAVERHKGHICVERQAKDAIAANILRRRDFLARGPL